MVHIEPLLYGFDVVVGAAGGFSAFEHSLHELVFVDFETYHGMDFGAQFGEKLCQSFRLGYGAWEAVENHAASYQFGVVAQGVGQNVDHEFVRYQQAVGYVHVGDFAKLCAAGYVVAQKLTGGYVSQSVVFDEFLALCPFAAAGRAENDNVHFYL